MSVILLIALAGCGSSDSSSKTNTVPAKQENTNTVPAKTSEPVKKNEDPTIEEQVVYDQDGITITAKSLDLKSFMGPELKLLIENNTDRAVIVQARNTSVNGYMVDTVLSADVAAGKKANDGLTIMDSSLKDAGITTIADIETSFHIFDSDTWNEITDTDLYSIKTSAYEGFEYTFDDSGKTVYENGGIKIVVKGLAEDSSFMGPEIVLYVENESGQDITVQARDVSVNGFMVQSILSSDVVNTKHRISGLSLLSSDLKENEIEKIETCEVSFHIFDSNTWNTIADTDPITISFE
ncbi:MAG: hypothetical protein IJJ30_07255 [Erysipelotrichaceae bacterium]|nr:hypothetical protein [Erysipelotrichaceae bacterium]